MYIAYRFYRLCKAKHQYDNPSPVYSPNEDKADYQDK